MAATVTIEFDEQIGDGGTLHVYLGTIVPGTYATGGVSVDPANQERLLKVTTDGTGGYVTAWDAANQKLKVFRQKDPANAGGADIALPEVANATDLSGVTFNFTGWGF